MNRKVTISSWLALFALVALISACSNTPEDRKLRGQIIGGATGAAVGSLFGSGTGQILATGAGAVLGTVVGGNLSE